MANRRLRSSIGQATLLGQLLFASLFGLGGLCLEAAIAPTTAHAYIARLDVTLDRRDANETYQALVRRAEVVARAAAQRNFDNDILVTDVQIFVNGQVDGLEAPLLSLTVSRTQWSARPATSAWATYYPASQNLLGLQP